VEPTLTSGFAAEWKASSWWLFFSFWRSVGFRRSPFVRFGLFSHGLMFCGVPLVRLLKIETLVPWVMRVLTRWLPMKLVPPVANTFSIVLVFILMNRLLWLVEFNAICENWYLPFVIVVIWV